MLEQGRDPVIAIHDSVQPDYDNMYKQLIGKGIMEPGGKKQVKRG